MKDNYNNSEKRKIAEITIASSLSNLSEIRKFVEKNIIDLNLNSTEVAKIVLAVEEACSNVVRHAYLNNPDKLIKISIYASQTELIIEIYDSGKSFDISLIKDPDIKQFVKQKKSGGFGVYLIKKIMDEAVYSKDPNGNNVLKLVKRLKNVNNK